MTRCGGGADGDPLCVDDDVTGIMLLGSANWTLNSSIVECFKRKDVNEDNAPAAVMHGFPERSKVFNAVQWRATSRKSK